MEHTHKVVLTLMSNKDDDQVGVSLEWSPPLEGKDIVDLGFIPASFVFTEKHILPMLEEAFMQGEHPDLMEDEPPSGTKH